MSTHVRRGNAEESCGATKRLVLLVQQGDVLATLTET
jgi:hypothetical protein